MSIVAIIGAGALGGTIAYRLAARDRVREVRLIDDALDVATATALDIQQSAAVQPFSTRVTAHRDLHAVVGADVLVLAGPVHTHVQPEGDHTAWTVDDGLRVIQQLATLNTRGVTVCAGGSHRRLVERGVATSCLPRHRLIGSAPYAFQLALRAIVAVELNCSAMDVSLSVLGHPTRAGRSALERGVGAGHFAHPSPRSIAALTVAAADPAAVATWALRASGSRCSAL